MFCHHIPSKTNQHSVSLLPQTTIWHRIPSDVEIQKIHEILGNPPKSSENIEILDFHRLWTLPAGMYALVSAGKHINYAKRVSKNILARVRALRTSRN